MTLNHLLSQSSPRRCAFLSPLMISLAATKSTDWIPLISSTTERKTTLCEATTTTNNNDQSQVSQEGKENIGCDTCLYTGIATCTGLSLYFGKLALEVPDITKDMPKDVAAMHRRSRFGFLSGAAVWVAIGIYRWHLG